MSQLADTLALHRDLYADDLSIPRLVSRTPPTTLDRHTGELEEEPADANGMNLSGPMIRFLGHPESWGDQHPWLKALWLLRGWCRREHPDHRGADKPFYRGSLCHTAVSLCVMGRVPGYPGPLSPSEASAVLRTDIEEVLQRALDWILEQIDRAQRDAIERERALTKHVRPVGEPEAPAPETPHNLEGAHAEECPRCLRRRREEAA
jgi:hypothetical protein